jgi:urease accessory protein
MEIIHGEIPAQDSGKPRIALSVDRLTLAKRRWRALAADGAEFGFILERPIKDGAIFLETETGIYNIVQEPEDLFEITPADATHAARVGWMIGNLHFPIAIEENTVRVPADEAVRQLLEREHVHFISVRKVFHALKATAGHHHHHEH